MGTSDILLNGKKHIAIYNSNFLYVKHPYWGILFYNPGTLEPATATGQIAAQWSLVGLGFPNNTTLLRFLGGQHLYMNFSVCGVFLCGFCVSVKKSCVCLLSPPYRRNHCIGEVVLGANLPQSCNDFPLVILVLY